MKTFDRFLDLFFVPTCVCCGEKLDAGVLCPTCDTLYRERKETVVCSDCGLPYSECDCIPAALRVRYIRACRKVFRYDSAYPDMPENRLLYAAKHRHIRDLTDFLAKETYASFQNGDTDNAVCTFMPRSRDAILRDGFDQSREIAKSLAALAGIPFLSLIENRKGKEQKALNRVERKQNALSYRLKKNTPALRGKTVILFDDVLTTGATLEAGARLLYNGGVSRVIIAVLGISQITPNAETVDYL